MSEPIVFCLDLDGTLQGNVNPQLIEHELIHSMNNIIVHGKKIRYNTQALYNDMSKGLIRPYVRETLYGIKNKHKNIEFFIYTASADEWANFILTKINKFLFQDDKTIINKPFLTRKHCIGNGKKSIENVQDIISKSLKNKYPNSNFNHIYLVDNNIVLQIAELKRLILCPSYDYKVTINPMRNLNEEHLTKYFNKISHELFRKPSKHKIEMLKIYYDNAYTEFENTEQQNEKFKDDNYWMHFGLIVMKSKLNTEKDINQMIQKLQKLYMTSKFDKFLKNIF